MLMRRTTALLAATFLCAILRAQATRVLFIGNSYTYTNDLPGLFAQLAFSLGEQVETGMSAPGGYTFIGHTQLAATQQLLAQGDWDFVVLQEQSQLPSFPLEQVEAECFPYAAQLVQQARAANPCTEPVFLMTWGRENGDAQNCTSWPPVCTYAGMQQLLRDRYVQMAVDNMAWCAPAGAVWREHRALHPSVQLYSDGSHPSITGSYIAACTLFSTLFRRSCSAASFEPAGLPAGQGAIIRELASSIVTDSSGTWNIGASDPVADADWTVLAGQGVLFANNTAGTATQLWSFGDGTTSTDADAFHAYATAGAYQVTLITTDECGRSDTLAFVVDIGTSVPEAGGTPMVRLDPEQRLLTCTVGHGSWEVLDATGRLLDHGRLSGHPQAIRLRPGWTGLLHWRIVRPNGPPLQGAFILP